MTAERLKEKERGRAACIFNLLVSGKFTVRKRLTQQACQMVKFAFLAPISLLCFLSKSRQGWRQVQHYVLLNICIINSASPLLPRLSANIHIMHILLNKCLFPASADKLIVHSISRAALISGRYTVGWR